MKTTKIMIDVRCPCCNATMNDGSGVDYITDEELPEYEKLEFCPQCRSTVRLNTVGDDRSGRFRITRIRRHPYPPSMNREVTPAFMESDRTRPSPSLLPEDQRPIYIGGHQGSTTIAQLESIAAMSDKEWQASGLYGSPEGDELWAAAQGFKAGLRYALGAR